MTIVLFSGGMDSTCLAYHARDVWGDPVHLLSCEYGQRHICELDAARAIAHEFVPASHKQVSVGPRGVGLRSMLTRQKGEVDAAGSVVPARNLWFLIAGALRAQEVGGSRICIGACADDAEVYADCRLPTIDAQAQALRLALEMDFEILAPFVTWDKRQIVQRSEELGCMSAMHKSWSCYQPVIVGSRWGEFEPCGRCPACVKRGSVL